MKIKAGTILAITQGEYSDYCLMGHVRALIDFDSKLARKKFAAQLTDEDRDEWWDVPKKYPAWLIREGLAEPCDEVIEFYLGSHSSSLIED